MISSFLGILAQPLEKKGSRNNIAILYIDLKEKHYNTYSYIFFEHRFSGTHIIKSKLVHSDEDIEKAKKDVEDLCRIFNITPVKVEV